MMLWVMGAPPSKAGGSQARSAWLGPPFRISAPLISLGSDSPILLTARTLNLYLCPVVRFSTLILRGEPSSVLAHWTQEPLPPVVSMHSTTYFLIGVPPSSAGSLQWTTRLSQNTSVTLHVFGGVGLSMMFTSMNFSHDP